jgi:hypothetical protein
VEAEKPDTAPVVDHLTARCPAPPSPPLRDGDGWGEGDESRTPISTRRRLELLSYYVRIDAAAPYRLTGCDSCGTQRLHFLGLGVAKSYATWSALGLILRGTTVGSSEPGSNPQSRSRSSECSNSFSLKSCFP